MPVHFTETLSLSLMNDHFDCSHYSNLMGTLKESTDNVVIEISFSVCFLNKRNTDFFQVVNYR